MKIESKIKEYAKLKEAREGIDKRLDELSSFIKDHLEEGKFSIGEYDVQIQVKDLTSLDENAAWGLLEELGYDPWEFTDDNPKLDPNKIEQEYLLGNLSDAHLRAIRNPKYSVALVVKPCTSQQ